MKRLALSTLILCGGLVAPAQKPTYPDVIAELTTQVKAQQDTINQLTTKTLELDNTVTLLQQRVEALEEKESK